MRIFWKTSSSHCASEFSNLLLNAELIVSAISHLISEKRVGSICSSQRDSPACKGSGECYEFDVADFPNHAWDCSGNVPQAAA